MSVSILQNYTAVGPSSAFAQFSGVGGTAPYSYAVVAGGAGGSINSSGVYTAPASITAYPASKLYDTIRVTDSLSAIATAQILVGTPLILFCEIIQHEMGLDNSHVYLWDQKVFQPTDSSLYVAVGVSVCKPFGNTIRFDGTGSGLVAKQYVNMWAMVDLDIISRGPAARDQKEFVIAALQSVYAQQQQEANGFYIGKLSSNFINLSHIDGAAIPYRFRISVAMQYAVVKNSNVSYFDTFEPENIYTDP